MTALFIYLFVSPIFVCKVLLNSLPAQFVSSAPPSADGRYVNGFPNSSQFFPIGVWAQSPTRAVAYKAIGINTYVGLWKGPTEVQLASLAKSQMFAITSQNEVGLHSSNGAIIKGWLQDDEPDNAQPIGFGLYGSCVSAAEVVRHTHEIKARDPSRPVMINFGQGVANPFWKGRGPCNGDENYYSLAARDADILSFDIYPVGSETPQVKGKLEYVARGVTRLRNLATDQQKVWTVIETTALDPRRAVTPVEVRAEIWMALIHGARGIVYFVHEFSPTFREDAIFRHPDVVEEVAEENSMIKALAPVLKGRRADDLVNVQSTPPIATLIKQSDNALYIFAVAMTNSESEARFFFPSLVGDRMVVVLGEKRNLNIRQQSFQDAFSGYGVHIYRVPLNRD